MRNPRPQPPSPANDLLAALPAHVRLALLRELAPVTLAFGRVLSEPGATIRNVYLPVRAVVSLLTVVDGRAALEVGLVGREGMVGVSLALGVGVSPVRVLVQGEGSALQMRAAPFRRLFEAHRPLRDALHRYASTLMAQITQTAACNRFHTVDARLARWLLMVRDRACSENLHLTQGFLADMLGVRRVGVTEAASALHRRALIEYSRGRIRILDPAGLQAAACSCYARLT